MILRFVWEFRKWLKWISGVTTTARWLMGRESACTYREGIEGTSHHLEQSLLPSTVYVWLVRTRNGAAVGPWSTYNFHEFDPSGSEWGKNLWWPFITPGSKFKDASGQSAPVPEGQGRIYFYREKRFVGLAMEPHIQLNFKTVGNSMNGGYFYVDRPPGNYVAVCRKGRKEKHEINFTLGPGENKVRPDTFRELSHNPKPSGQGDGG